MKPLTANRYLRLCGQSGRGHRKTKAKTATLTDSQRLNGQSVGEHTDSGHCCKTTRVNVIADDANCSRDPSQNPGSGFRQQAPAALTPAQRLKLTSSRMTRIVEP